MPETLTESFTEIRCFCCVPLGYYSSRLLLRVRGIIQPQNVYLELKCPRCNSVVEWGYGKPEFRVVKEGTRNHKRQSVVFE